METRLAHVPWRLAVLLGVLALVRPLANITGLADVLGKPGTPIVLLIGVSAAWLVVVLATRRPDPVLTLTFAGLAYGALVIVLSGVLSPLLSGSLQGPLTTPGGIGVVMTLLVNAAWGALVGLLAAGINSLRHRSDAPEP